jgi:hypothetical protein
MIRAGVYIADDDDLNDCEFCLSFDTGPIQTRSLAYQPGEGHEIEPGVWPSARVQHLEDGWLAMWDQKLDDGPPYLVCPYHATDRRVPRPDADMMVGDVAVDLQEFDCVGGRPPDIVMFKQIRTRQYLNLAMRNGRVVWCDYNSEAGVVERDVTQGFPMGS